MNANNQCELYLITPEKFVLSDFTKQLKDAFSGGYIAALQLRVKNLSENEVEEYAKAIMPIARDNGAVFILNDYISVAANIGVDGVHLGIDDMPIKDARKLLGEDVVIGASCYASRDLAFDAGEAGADYVAFGAFYDTQTKTPRGRPEPEILSWWREYTVLPSVAIGGIKAHNLAPLVKAKADFIAVVTAVWNHEKGSKYAVTELINSIKQAEVTT